MAAITAMHAPKIVAKKVIPSPRVSVRRRRSLTCLRRFHAERVDAATHCDLEVGDDVVLRSPSH